MARVTVTIKRKPVPRVWREEHHELDVRSHVAGGGWGGWSRTYRARGECSCGARFNPDRLPDGTPTRKDTMDREGVIDAWKDHVAQAYHGDDYYVRTEVAA